MYCFDGSLQLMYFKLAAEDSHSILLVCAQAINYCEIKYLKLVDLMQMINFNYSLDN